MNNYEPVIGLEVHVQLQTQSKLFCNCPNSFGRGPNTLICPVCTGMPGVLPVLNRQALKLGLRVALALNCQIHDRILFERKNYFYPDLPKGYQISQYALPLGYSGHLNIKKSQVRINRVHLEEDAGKLIHKKDASLVDLNRAGVPLLEIVSEPDISSPQQAYDYLSELKLIFQYIEASSCDMEKGFLRCDANISIRKRGVKELGTKTELKNMNSFRQVRLALEYETRRQEKALTQGNKVELQTRLWDENSKQTKLMRSKEESHDYRYFPEPDLVCYNISPEDISAEKELVGELPARKRSRLKEKYNLNPEHLNVLVSDVFLSRFFEDCADKYPDTQKIVNWIIGPLRKILNERNTKFNQLNLNAGNFVKLVRLMDNGKITNIIAKQILPEIIDKGKDPEDIIKSRRLESVSNTTELTAMVKEIIAANPKAAADYKNGKSQAIMFLVGQVMKKTKGKANPEKLKVIFKDEIIKR